ncbi:MAG: D-alanine--D-alanine ligase [bacterium]|nr:D-alanine--D-alanine ligase [bacterium]
MEKLRVGIIFGGKSAEHEVSLRSARSVSEAIDREMYEPIHIGIDTQGNWFLREDVPREIIREAPRRTLVILQNGGGLLRVASCQTDSAIDVAFPILHGPFGEDGTMQGLLKLADIPFVGAGVLGSAVGMDKDVMKRLLRDANIPIAKFLVAQERHIPIYQEAKDALGLPLFVKPANMGSSVGVSKARNEKEFQNAVEGAFLYDTKVILEEFIQGRELECSVLGNNNLSASVPGEVVPTHEFYSYKAKYLDENGATLEIPANISPQTTQEIQSLAIRTFQTLSCEGLGRVDFFLKDTGEILVNEINTMPGFTSISMYPKLWEASGVPYSELISRLIRLARERFEKEKLLKTLR